MANGFENMSDAIILPRGIRERYIVAGVEAEELHACGIQAAGLSEVYPPYLVMKKNSPYHMIVYSVSGKGIYKNDYGEGAFKPGSFWISPAKCHHFYKAEDEWNLIYLMLADIECWQFLHEWKGGQRYSIWLSSLKEAMEGYIAESIHSGIDARSATRAFGDLMGIYLNRDIRAEKVQSSRRMHHKLDQLWNEVNSKLQHSWTVGELAQVITISPGHLYRLVSSHNNASPMGMVTMLRMKKAKELLLHTDYPIKLISDLTGYQTPYSFSKTFKRHTGISPGAFRHR